MPVSRWLRSLRRQADRFDHHHAKTAERVQASGSRFVGIEPLEPRLLLTALVGGDSFEFQDAAGLYGAEDQIVRITLEGNIFVELIGATIDENNQALFADIPGVYVSSTTGKAGAEVGGGIGGADGVELIGPTPIVDPFSNIGDIDWDAEGNENINIQAIASDATGNTYGFNVATVVDIEIDDQGNVTETEQQVVQLLSINNDTGTATVIADLHLREDEGLHNVSAVRAADFDPISGLLYFVASIGDTDLDRLFTVDVNAGVKADIEASVAHIDGFFREAVTEADVVVHSIAFDQTGPGAARLLAAIDRGAEDAGIELFTISLTNTDNMTRLSKVTLNGVDVDSITGIEFVDDDPTGAETYVFAIMNTDSADELLRVTIASGVSRSFGQLPDPDDTGEALRGEDIGGLTWNPTLQNPFTGDLGVLLGTDVTTDELVYIDHRPRFPYMNVFAIYVAQADANSSITISVIDPGGERPMTPFVGDAGGFRVTSYAGQSTVITAPENTGGVYIGIKTIDINPSDPNDDLIPILDGALEGAFGLRPANFDDLPADGGQNLTAGVVVTESLLDFVSNASGLGGKLIGQNVDEVTKLAASRDGQVIAIDSDRVDANGDPVTGDELVLIDRVTGKALDIAIMNDGVNPLSGALGLAFADLNFNGTEDLYAIYEIGGDMVLGTVNHDPDSVDFGLFSPIATLNAAIGDVKAMAFSDLVLNGLYVINTSNELFQVNPNTGAIIASIGAITDADTDETLNIDSFDFNHSGQAFGHDVDNGRLVDISTATGVAGANTATTVGSLRPTLSAIAYSGVSDVSRFLVVDNHTGRVILENEGSSIESSVLMYLVGTESDSAEEQDLLNLYIAGTWTGHGHFSGSVDRIYAGWLVTGQMGGQVQTTAPTRENNLYIAHDVRDILSLGSIGATTVAEAGGEPEWASGTHIVVGGRAGQIRSFASVVVTTNIENQAANVGTSGLAFVQREIEVKPSGETDGALFEAFELHNAEVFYNDTFDTAQFLGSISTTSGGEADSIRVVGNLDSLSRSDSVDYYGLAMMAGSTVVVQLQSDFNFLNVGVFDPDGRLIQTDYSSLSPGEIRGTAFRFRADRPGVYRIAVGFPGDINFDGEAGEGESVTFSAIDYELLISEVGDVALGAVVAAAHMYASTSGPSTTVARGDLGLIQANEHLYYSGFSTDVLVSKGDLRTVFAGQIGAGADDGSFGVNIEVPEGSIGLIQSLGLASLESVEIGGDLQVVDVAEGLFIRLSADGGLGVLRAGDMASGVASVLAVNADNSGADGIIDLIDVAGDFGTVLSGGPQITTGTGGNVRFMRIGGEIFQDTFFGGGSVTTIEFSTGETFNFVDDSGGTIRIDPEGPALDPNAELVDDGQGNMVAPPTRVRVTSYGIRDKAGSVLVKLNSNGSLNISGIGVNNGAPVEISEVFIEADGAGLILDETTGKWRRATAADFDGDLPPDLYLRISGNRPVDIFSLLAASDIPTSPNDAIISTIIYNEVDGSIKGGAFTELSNTTGGDIVSMTIGGAAKLVSTGHLGSTRNHTGADVLGNYNSLLSGELYATLPYPFNLHRNAIVSGTIIDLIAHKSVGNLFINSPAITDDGDFTTNPQSLVNLEVNAGGVDDPDSFEGIRGPIVVTGDLNKVSIGEGIAPSGNGAVSFGGLFVMGTIGSITNSSKGGFFPDLITGEAIGEALASDIRGDIISNTAIKSIKLVNGSIVNADIMVISDFAQSQEGYFGKSLTSLPGGTVDKPVYEIGSISVSGTGGIIGADIVAADVGPITVGSFGFFESLIRTSGDGVVGNITVGGYGIRNVTVVGGASLGNVTAKGKGGNISTATFDRSIRLSEDFATDPFSGFVPTSLTDIHSVLGTSKSSPTLPLGAAAGTREGIVSGFDARGSRSMGTLTAFRIYDTSLHYANSIKGITTKDLISNLSVTTGQLGTFKPGTDVFGLDLEVAGAINSIQIKGDLANGSIINASGPSGYIKSLTVNGDMDGSVLAGVSIGTINIKGDLSGDIVILGLGLSDKQLALSKLTLGGDFDGSLNVTGNVGTITAAGSFGGPGQSLEITGNLNALTVGTNKSHDGATLGSDLRVLGDLKKLTVTGQIDGLVEVGGDLLALIVTADAGSDATIVNGEINVGRDLKSAKITGGNVAESINVIRDLGVFSITNGDLDAPLTVGRNIGTVTIVNGDVTTDGAIVSALGNIKTVTIKGGDLLGDLKAVNGVIGTVTITGSDIGDGVNAVEIFADAITSLKIDGNIRDLVTITVVNGLGTLTVGGNVEEGAAVEAGWASTIAIGGDLAGQVEIGYTAAGTKLTVGGVTGSATTTQTFGGNLTATLKGGMADGGTLVARRDLSLASSGIIAGNVLVDLALTKFTAAGLDGANIVTGLDATSIAISGAVVASLVQIGASKAANGSYEDGRRRIANLGSFTAGSVEDSIIAAGGNIGTYKVPGETTNSSVSSGFVLGGEQIDDILDGSLDLTAEGDRNTARSEYDLFWGDFANAQFGTLTDSVLSAGVGAGATGDWATPEVLSSNTGGASRFGKISGTVGADALVIADAGISTNSATVAGGTITPAVDYDALGGDLSTNNPLETPVAGSPAAAGSPLVYVTDSGHVVTVTVSGPGSVHVLDEAGADSDDHIDSIVLVDTTGSTTVKITTSTPGAVSIGRIISADDVALNSLTFDGDLVGDGSDDPDLWIDGPVKTLTLRDLGDAVNGRIGGPVNTLTLRTLGAGARVTVGGSIGTLNVANSSSGGVVQPISDAPTANVTRMATDASGNTWLYDAVNNTITQVDPNTGDIIAGPFSVTDAITGADVPISGLDFAADGTLWATGVTPVQTPNVVVGALSVGTLDLHGLAQRSDGLTVAVDSSTGTDRLVSINPNTGAATVLGTLKDVFGHTYSQNFLALAFSPDSGKLYALVNDRDGTFEFFDETDGVVLVQVEVTDVNNNGALDVSNPFDSNAPGIFLEAGTVTDNFNALFIRDDDDFNDTDDIFAIRRVAGTDHLVQFTLVDGPGVNDDVTITDHGAVSVGGDGTHILGAGFNGDGTSVLAMSEEGASMRLVAFDIADPSGAQFVSAEGDLSIDLDAFAVALTGSTPRTFSYETGAAIGTFYTNPSDGVETLGTIDTTTGEFTAVRVLAQDVLGTPLSAAVRDIAVDNAGTGDLFVVDAQNRLFRYDLNVGSIGALVGTEAIGTVTDALTDAALDITAIDFNDDTGELYGLDNVFKTLVSIGTADASAAQLLESGSVDTDPLRDLTFDDDSNALRSFRDTTDKIVEFTATEQDDQDDAGIFATSFNKVNINGGDEFSGRLIATGNSFGNISVVGDFTGVINSFGGPIGGFKQTDGDFGGRLFAQRDINKFSTTGSVLQTAVVESRQDIKSFTSGDFAGLLQAITLGTFKSGEFASSARLLVERDAKTVTVTGDMDGLIELMNVPKLMISGALGSGASLNVGGLGTTSVTIGNGADAGSSVVLRQATTVTVGGEFSGQFAVNSGLKSARFGDITDGIVLIGGDTGSFTAGNVTDSVISFGTWVGDDGVYNSDDDRLVGAFVKSVSVGAFTDSALVAGVLPNQRNGEGIPADRRAYVGNTSAADPRDVDSAEAGGLFESGFGSIAFKGLITSNAPASGLVSVVAAAGDLGKMSGSTLFNLRTRSYSDPFGAPEVVLVSANNPAFIEVIFSEEINTASLIASIDGDNDGSLDGLADTVGTVTLVDSLGNIIDDITLTHSKRTSEAGVSQSVLKITRPGGFEGINLTVTLDGTSDAPIVDRSGLRSLERDLNLDGVQDAGEDFRGTILDGDNDGIEGGDHNAAAVLTEAPDTFEEASVQNAIPLVTNGGSLTVSGTFDSISDIDIYRINGTQYEYLMIELDAVVPPGMALFFRDTQGTIDASDDTFELVTRYVSVFDSGFMAVELPETGQYYLVVAPFISVSESQSVYSVELTMASTDDQLDGVADAAVALPPGEVIAYVSNTIGEHNNVVGANTPKQLIYLNFAGGVTTQFDEGGVSVSAFDAGILDVVLSGETDRLINGSMDVTGIVANLVDIFSAFPASLGGINVGTLDEAGLALITELNDLPDGITFTTVDPTTVAGFGSVSEVEFTTAYIGSADDTIFGLSLLGIASTIDFANMEKSNEVIVFAQQFAGGAQPGTVNSLLNQYARYFANVIAHELGHVLGLNHQPTSFADFLLVADDPDNDELNGNDGNTGVGVMAYAPTEKSISELSRFGTMRITTNEFPIGWIDTAQLLKWWLS